MTNSFLVSIIIPTYNRAHLIVDTLKSIIAQSYSNWECIFVDDGSEDNTNAILDSFCKKDSRIKYYSRPENKPKGANSCRNYGLEISKGDFIIFFDSDDIMFPEKIEASLNALKSSNADYVISKTIDFNHPDSSEIFISNSKNYNFENYPLTHFNYVSQNLNWLTPDALIKSDLAKKVRFNETLKRGQEYNFYVKLTCISENGFYLGQFTTKRRLHDESIKNTFNQIQVDKQAVLLRMITLEEIYLNTTKDVKVWYINNIAKNITRLNMFLSIKQEWFLLNHLFKYFGFKSVIYYTLSRLSKRLFNKNEFLRKYLKLQLK